MSKGLRHGSNAARVHPRTFAVAAISFAVLLTSGVASAVEVDLLWYDGPTCFVDGENVAIDGSCGGDLLSQPNTFGPIALDGYSNTWDVTNELIGTEKQLDYYLIVDNIGLLQITMSIRYDQGGTSVLDAIAAREYNLGVRPVDGKFACQPLNSCTRVVITGTTFAAGTTWSIDDQGAGDTSGGEVRRIGNNISPGAQSLGTKKSTQTVVFRVGSIIFELTERGSTEVYGAIGSGEIFNTRDTNGTSGEFFAGEPDNWWSATVLDAAGPPSNDDCSGALDIPAVPYQSPLIDTANATTGTGDSSNCAAGMENSTVWFTYTTEVEGVLVASTEGSDYDTILSYWDWNQSSCAFASDPGTETACNDDVDPGVDVTSRLEIAVLAGETYRFRVGTEDAQGGNLLFSLPEPSHALLAISGILSVAALRRRRSH